MSIKSLILKNKWFTTITIGFLAWLIFILVLLFINVRQVTFHNALGQVDVSDNYSSVLPVFRYVLEPFAIIAFILEMEFSWMFVFLMVYPIIRILFVFARKKGKFKSRKLGLTLRILREIIEFSFKVLLSAVLIILVIILIGFSIQGFFFVNRYFMIPVQIAVHSSIILIVIKTCYIMIKLVHPNLKLIYTKSKGKKWSSKRSKRITTFKREIIYFVGIGVLLLGQSVVLISTPFCPHKVVPNTPLAEDEFLIDLHVHTMFSDGWFTPEERVLWYIEQGISIAAFSDHDNLRGGRIARKFVNDYNLDFLVLTAEEWTDHDNDIHMNYYGIDEEIVPLESYTPGGPMAMNASDLISYVKSNGGYVTVNHYNYEPNPNGGNGVPYSLEQLHDWGVDGFEIVNGGNFQGKYMHIRQFCLDNNLTCMGGSDIHTNEDLNTFIRMRLVDPTNKSIDNIFRTLRNNTHEVVAIEFFPNVINFADDFNNVGFYVFEEFINYMLNANMFQVISWIAWSSGVYILFSLIYWRLKKINITLIRKKFT
ncbi:MAG: PHP domain-containing protein [Promethearchaeota archaeon]